VVLGVGVAQPLVFHFGGGALGWHVMAMVFAGLCLVSMLTPALGLRKAQHARTQAASPALLAQISSVASNKPFCVLLLTSFIQSVSQACSYTVIGFFYLYVLKNVSIILTFVLVMCSASLVAQPMWISLSRRFGKERCFVAASLGFVAITLTWFLVRPGDDVLVRLPLAGALSTQDVLVLGRAIVIGLLNSGFTLLTLSMLTDTIDLQRQRHGFAQEGVFSGLFSALEKLAFATGPLIAGVVLSASGFLSSTGGAVSQPHKAVIGIQLIYSLIPAGILLSSLAVFSQYRVREKGV
jgi:GPH family glycoside/pentoside/hexuronide:cation symporter